MRRLILTGLLLVLAALLLAACGDDGDKTTPTATPPAGPTSEPATPTPWPTWTPAPLEIQPDDTPLPTPRPEWTAAPAAQVAATGPSAKLRVVNATSDPDLPLMRVMLDDQLIVNERFTPGAFHEVPRTFSPGEHTLRVLPPDNPTPLLEAPLQLYENQSVIVVLAGDSDGLQLVLYTEDLSPLPLGAARLDLVHAVPGDDPVTLREEGESLLDERAFKGRHQPVETAAGTHYVTVARGTDVLDTLAINSAPGTTYTLILTQPPGSDTYDVLQLEARTERQSHVRVVNASAQHIRVEAAVDGILLPGGQLYRADTEWYSLAPGTHQFSVALPDSADAPLLERSLGLQADQAVDLILYDGPGGLSVVQANANLSQTPPDGAWFTFVNVSVQGVQVEVTTPGSDSLVPTPVPADVAGDTVSGTPELFRVPFGTATSPTLITAGDERNPARSAFFFQNFDAPDTPTIGFVSEREWQAGTAYTIVIEGHERTPALVLAYEVGTTSAPVAAPAGEATQVVNTFDVRVVNALAGDRLLSLVLLSREDLLEGSAGTLLFENVPPRTGTGYLPVQAEVGVLVLLDSLSGEELYRADVTWSGALRVSLFAFEDGSGGVRFELAPDTIREVPDGEAYVRLLNIATMGSPEAPGDDTTLQLIYQEPAIPVAEGEEDDGTPVPMLDVPLSEAGRFGQPTDPALVRPDVYDVLVIKTQTELVDEGGAQVPRAVTSTVATVPDLSFASGVYYDVLLLPTGPDTPPFVVQVPLEG